MQNIDLCNEAIKSLILQGKVEKLTDDAFKTKTTPIIEQLFAEVKTLESKVDEIEADLEFQKSEAQDATREAEFKNLEDSVKKWRRTIALLTRKLLASRLMVDESPCEELLDLLRSGRRC
ncbi:unnamed protein product [Rhizoctonia solani]|uniref:Uncharacterized protein n=1 Tax=Rhizoctonia solani TaxID=456999 RepID=A0A8H3DT59_9AGAM|nr:unnamed protein product [Rhizoctonia solani]